MVASGVEDENLQPDGPGGCFHLSQVGHGIHVIGRIDEHREANGGRHQLAQQFQPLGVQLAQEEIDACRIAARPSEAGDWPAPLT